MKIIFLDIDGVLNSQNYMIKTHPKKIDYYRSFSNKEEAMIESKMFDIDFQKLELLKKITEATNSKIVIISTWKSTTYFQDIKNRLIELGIPIIGETIDNNSNRGSGIYNYIQNNDIEDYIIIDDEISEDYDEELLSHLVKTSFYKDGLEEPHKEKAIKMLSKKLEK